jgi:hypothetical protein
MCRIANENQTVFRPGRQRLHVMERPESDILAGERDDLLHAGTEPFEALDQHISGAGLIMACSSSLVLLAIT